MYKNRTFIRRFFDVPTWIGAGQLTDGARAIKSMVKESLSASYGTSENPQTFDEAVVQYGYSDEFLEARQRFLLTTALIYLFCSALLISYAVYLFMLNAYLNGITTSCVSLILVAFAFRSHFWYTQIKQRTLGLSFSDWFYSLFFSKTNAR